MDLNDFSNSEQTALYFDEVLPQEVESLLADAAEHYGEAECEHRLLKAFFLVPESLTVLVSLYRMYFYQHRYEETLVTASHALRISGARLGFPPDWRELQLSHLDAELPLGLVRFYLFALKGMAYVKMRMGELEDGEAMIDKVMALDPEDRLGASVLKEVILDTRRRPRLVV